MKTLRCRKGVAAIEFALVLPILIVLAFGIIEFSLALYDHAMLTNASREGARTGILFRADASGNYAPLTDAEIGTVVTNYLSNYLITFGTDPNIVTTASPGSRASGDMLTVTVTYTYGFLVLPGFVAGLGAGIPLNATTVMRME